MSNTPHIQRTGVRRSTVVAAIVAAALGLATAGSPAAVGHGQAGSPTVAPMPGGGCGGYGC